MAAPPIVTVRDIIESAYKKLGEYSHGEAIDSNDMNDGLNAFRNLLAEMVADNLTIPAYTIENFPLVVGQNSYTIGENGTPDFDTVRPEQIVSAFIRVSDYDYPIRMINERAYNQLPDKSTGAERPQYLWYNPTVPNGTIYLYRTPASTDSIYLTSVKPLIDGAALTNDIMINIGIPRNFANPVIYGLAVNLAPEMGLDVPQAIAVLAQEGVKKIRNQIAMNRAQPSMIEFAKNYDTNNDLVRYV